jgi:hypothetical protein
MVVASDTESDGKGSYPNNNEESSIIKNQAGILSSPPPASENVSHNELNHDNDGEFHLKQRYVQTQTPNQPRAALNFFFCLCKLELEWINASQRLAQLVNLVVFVL